MNTVVSFDWWHNSITVAFVDYDTAHYYSMGDAVTAKGVKARMRRELRRETGVELSNLEFWKSDGAVDYYCANRKKVIMKTQGRFDVADMKTDRIWRFRWVYRNDVGGYAPHYNFYVWDGVSGCWTSVHSSFDLNEGVAYVEHMDKSELNTYLAYPTF